MSLHDLNFLLVGVGGQGVVFASDLLSEVGLAKGYDVKKSEVHGMAQRGGVVESHVRWGRRVLSPLIARGEADYLVGFELLESARWAEFLAPGGCAIVSNYRIPPLRVNEEEIRYPTEEKVKRLFSSYTPKVYMLNTETIAREMGHQALVGVAVLGALAALVDRDGLDADESVWVETIRVLAPKGLIEKNIAAFAIGREMVTSDRKGKWRKWG